MPKQLYDWELWYPKAGATGILFARGRADPTAVMLVHAVPPVLTVTVRTEGGDGPHNAWIAQGVDLPATAETPIARLTLEKAVVRREDIWPTRSDIGCPVLLPGGEIGILLQWWHAEDHSEWRWQVEFYNCIRR